MAKKITEKTMPEDKNTADLIKSLGGAQRIYKYLLSKNKNITVESIYKWKKNGIPYRYRTAIEELSANNNITIMDNAFLDKKSYENHMEVIHKVAHMKCGICDEYFSQKSILKSHIINFHEGEKIYKCKFFKNCCNAFLDPEVLEDHMDNVCLLYTSPSPRDS